MNIKEIYQQSVDKYASEVAALKRKNNGFITGELLLFGAMLAFVVCYIAIDEASTHWLWGAVCSLIAYFQVRRLDDKNKERIEHLSALKRVCQNELTAMDGDFSPFEQGNQYQNPKHPYSLDLDVFGRDSLFNRICRTITTGGSGILAANLSREYPLSKEELAKRTALQKELAEQGEDWRMEFFALGEKNKNEVLDGPARAASYSKLNNLQMDMAAEPTRRVIGYQKIDSAAVADAMRKVSEMAVPAWYGSMTSLVVGWLLIIGVVASVVLAYFDIVSVNVPLWWVMLQYMAVFFVCKQTLDKIDSNGGKLRKQLIAYSQILQLIAHRNFHSELGKQMQADLAEALPSFAQLEKILKGYDRRGNFLGLFFTDAFMLSDFFLVRSFLKWKNTYMVKMEEWMGIVSEMDAAVSMADFRFNHPEAKDAEIVEENLSKKEELSVVGSQKEGQTSFDSSSVDTPKTLMTLMTNDLNDHNWKKGNNKGENVDNELLYQASQPIVFEAKNLYHPFLGAKAVKNDFVIKDGNYYIVTGANMAGKSTFLRSLGVNYILAMAGMPVFADSLRLSRFRLFSSMRTTDDLTHGISYFNAELIRLEQLMQYCKGERYEGQPLPLNEERQPLLCNEERQSLSCKGNGKKESLRTLIILDEILKGTNSVDKLNGSRLFLEAISKLPVSGVIATHDLELSKMEDEHGGKAIGSDKHEGRFHNYCFEIDLGTDVTYTYKIGKGIAKNQNATFLLNKIIAEHL